MAQRIEVHESSRLPYFRKDRWYDLEADGRDSIDEMDGTTWQVKKWTVDDDRIWTHLRFTIEIANRILTAFIRDNNDW
jgi:hypothetical protein